MPYTKDSVPASHSEFGGGPGLIDPVVREDRDGLTNEERRMEIMFTNPDPPEVAHGSTDEERAARAAVIEEQNDPATTPVPRIQVEE